MSARSCAITSQNDTAPKLSLSRIQKLLRAITSQNDTAPKLPVSWHPDFAVRLPVRTTLLQNGKASRRMTVGCDYQSERHCSKTTEAGSSQTPSAITSQNDTAPKLAGAAQGDCCGAITSQNDTAPKLS